MKYVSSVYYIRQLSQGASTEELNCAKKAESAKLSAQNLKKDGGLLLSRIALQKNCPILAVQRHSFRVRQMGLKVTVIDDFDIACRILEVASIDNDFTSITT